MSGDSLDELGARIERLTVDPDAIDAPVVRLVRPVLATFGYEAKVSVQRAKELLEMVHKGAADPDELARAFERARDELEGNVTRVERATVVGRRALVGHAAWLRRVFELLVRVARVMSRAGDSALLESAQAIEALRIMPPLVVGRLDAAPAADAVINVELAAIDHLLAAANDEGELLGRRRRLLDAARQMLLESSAAVSLDEEGLGARRRYLAKEIARLDRLEAQGLAPEVALTHQAREALTRGERDRLHAAMVAMRAPALARGDDVTARVTGRALEALWTGHDPRDPSARDGSRRRSSAELFGEDFVALVERGYAKGKQRYAHVGGSASAIDREAAEASKTYFHGAASGETLAAAVGVDGCFDTGGALVPLRIVEHETRLRVVSHPARELLLLPASSAADVPDAIIEDPRSVILDLAAGRLLARRFVEQEHRARSRTVLRGEVRVYVLDGSGSMNGPRARVRDALLLAELATLRERVTTHAKQAHVVLFYRYFDVRPHPLTRVDSAATAEAAILDVVSRVRVGGTDIESALLSSFETVREAGEKDPDLARAQVVLVTDGDSPVDAAKVTHARERLGPLPVGLSVIALGQENPALRELVRRERARGEKAFYHYVPDDMLEDLAKGELDQGASLHLPRVRATDDSPDALAREVGALVEEMEALARNREVEAMELLDARSEAEGDLGLAKGESLTEGERARARALYRDRAALDAQFDRFFPQPAREKGEADVDEGAVVVALSVVTEMLEVVGGSPLARRADAIDLLERLLPDARLSPARWNEVVSRPTETVARGLSAVRAAVGPA